MARGGPAWSKRVRNDDTRESETAEKRQSLEAQNKQPPSLPKSTGWKPALTNVKNARRAKTTERLPRLSGACGARF